MRWGGVASSWDHGIECFEGGGGWRWRVEKVVVEKERSGDWGDGRWVGFSVVKEVLGFGLSNSVVEWEECGVLVDVLNVSC